MKKLFLLLFAASTILLAQSDKGKISFIYNDKSFSIPFNIVEITKGEDEHITLLMKGEVADSLDSKIISLEFLMKNLKKPYQIKMAFEELNKKNDEGEEFYVYYGDDAKFKFGKYNKGVRTIWEANEIKMRIGDIKTEYVIDRLIITGDFKFEITSNLIEENKAVLNDGKFEIII